MAGIVMGSIGLLAAIVVSLPRWAPHWLSIWLAAAALAFVLGGALVARQIASRGHGTATWGRPENFCSAFAPRCSPASC